MTNKSLIIYAILLAAGWLAAPEAEAHSIYIFAYPDGPKICTSSYFNGQSKVRGGQVAMLAADGEALATATSDDRGEACFDRPETAQDLIFRVESSGGHQGEFALTLADQGESAIASEAAAVQAAAAAPVEAAPAALCAGGLTQDDLRQALATVHLKLAEMESRQNSRVSLNEIIGGLGWIIGLAGAALWAAGRKKTGGGA